MTICCILNLTKKKTKQQKPSETCVHMGATGLFRFWCEKKPLHSFRINMLIGWSSVKIFVNGPVTLLFYIYFLSISAKNFALLPIDLLFHLCITYSTSAFPATYHIHNNGWAHKIEKHLHINI